MIYKTETRPYLVYISIEHVSVVLNIQTMEDEVTFENVTIKVGNIFESDEAATIAVEKWAESTFCPLTKVRYQAPALVRVRMERELKEGGVGDALMELIENLDQTLKEPVKE